MTPNDNSTSASPVAPQGIKPHRLMKLGVDVHWRDYAVVRQIDGTAPQSAQCFSPEAFIAWAAKQAQQADVVHCCYEAGPFSFGLHRPSAAAGHKKHRRAAAQLGRVRQEGEDRPARCAGFGFVP